MSSPRLKKVEILGFKSFHQKTKVLFSSGITSIVGPNGCGKSNFSDAMRWCIGEQKGRFLRIKSSTDLIFQGTESHRPLNLAQVSITFDNKNRQFQSDEDEVEITRRLFRNGDAEYLLNKKKVRLKDIQTVLSGTGLGEGGYFIVEQGGVDRILSASIEKRRLLFEEVAGISLYRKKTEDTSKKLDQVHHNMERIKDILNEVSERRTSLLQEVEKVKKHEELTLNLKQYRKSLFAFQYEKKSNHLQKLQQNLQEIKNLKDEKDTELIHLENLIEKTQSEEKEVKKDYISLKEEYFQLKSSIDEQKRKQVQIEQASQTLQYNQKELKKKYQSLGNQITLHKNKLQKMEIEQESLENSYQERQVQKNNKISLIEKEKEKVKNFQIEEQNYLKILTQKKTQYEFNNSQIQSQQKALQQQENKQNIQKIKYEELQEKKQQSREELQKNIQQLEQIFQTETQELQKIESIQKELHTNKESLELIKQDIQEKHLQVKSIDYQLKMTEKMIQNYEGFSDKTKNFFKKILPLESQTQDLILGTVSELISIEEINESLFESIFHEKLELIVVHSFEKAFNFLEKQSISTQGLGFIAQNSSFVESIYNEPQMDSFVTPLISFIQFDNNHLKKVLTPLFKNYYVLATNDQLKQLKKIPQGALFISLEGASYQWNGIWNFKEKKRFFLNLVGRKKRIHQLKEEIDEKKNLLSNFEQQQQDQEKKISKIEDSLSQIQGQHQQTIKIKNELSQSINHLKLSIEHHSQHISEIKKEINQIDKELLETINKISDLSEKNNEQQKDISSKTSEFETIKEDKIKSEEVLSKMKEEFDVLNEDLHQIQLDLSLRKERKSHSQQLILRTEKEKGEIEYRQKRVEEKKIQSTKEYQNILEKIKEYQKKIQDQEKKIQIKEELQEEQSQNVLMAVADIKEKRKEKNSVDQEWTKVQLSFSKNQEQLNYLIQNFKQDILINETASNDIKNEQIIQWKSMFKSETYCQENLQKIENKINQIGSIQTNAKEEFEQIEKRFQILSQNYNDLENSSEALNDLKTTLLKKSESLFKEAFQKITLFFDQYFQCLFKGGQSKFYLSPHKSILEADIHIEVALPGKRSKDMSLLSGGEKTLISLALLMAFFSVNPAPFCLLDEVDAPLDDSNVKRLMNLIESLSEHTQFVLITHNKISMQYSSSMNGVTMASPGVSSIIPVPIENYFSKKE